MTLALRTDPETPRAVARDAREGWRASLHLRFTEERGRTVLRKEHAGPLVVQRPFYPSSDGTCHVYVIHPPGGVVGGDRLELSADLEPDTRALITTPGAAKFYRTAGAAAVQRVRLTVARGASAEWLPQETIAFSGCRADLATAVELEEGASFIGWEILCLGRPAAGERFTSGCVRQALTVHRDGVPLLVERSEFDAAGPVPAASWGLGGHAVVATLAATTEDPTAVSALRDGLGAQDRFAVTRLRGVLLCRYVGPSTAEARDLFRNAWELLHPRVTGGDAVAPRIWAT